MSKQNNMGTYTLSSTGAGPTSGGAAAPTFRALVSADLPAGVGTVIQFSAGNLSPLFTTSVSNPTTTPDLTFSLTNAESNFVFAGPASGGPGAPAYRQLVGADLPFSPVVAASALLTTSYLTVVISGTTYKLALAV